MSRRPSEEAFATYIVGLLAALAVLFVASWEREDIFASFHSVRDPLFSLSIVDWMLWFIIMLGLFIIFRIPAMAFGDEQLFGALAAITLLLCYFPIMFLLMLGALWLAQPFIVRATSSIQDLIMSLFILSFGYVLYDSTRNPAKWQPRFAAFSDWTRKWLSTIWKLTKKILAGVKRASEWAVIVSRSRSSTS